jgi:hypothetical protein
MRVAIQRATGTTFSENEGYSDEEENDNREASKTFVISPFVFNCAFRHCSLKRQRCPLSGRPGTLCIPQPFFYFSWRQMLSCDAVDRHRNSRAYQYLGSSLMRKECGHIVETPVEARAGFLDRPVLIVLIVGTALIIGGFALVYLGFFAQ